MGQLDHSGSDFTRMVENGRISDAVPGGGNSLGAMLEGMNKTINQAVESHIKNGDFVKPAGQPSSLDARAATLARETEHAGMTKSIFGGLTPRVDGMAYYGPGMNQYVSKTSYACRDIDKQEEGLARKRWESLSPAERSTIVKEKSAQEAYEMQMVYRTDFKPPATPHFDAFSRAVKQDIAPLESERQARQHEVWKGLPVETKASIFRAQEEAKHFKAM